MAALFRAVAYTQADMFEGFGRTEKEAREALAFGAEPFTAGGAPEAAELRKSLEDVEIERVEPQVAYRNGEIIAQLSDGPADRGDGRTVPRFRHVAMTGGEFVARMAEIDMSEIEFGKLTGARHRTIATMKDEGPPPWVRLILMLLASERARNVAHRFMEQHIRSEDDYRANKEAAK